MSKSDSIFDLCDIIRETSFNIHKYLGPGHLEKVYSNSLAHRLRKQNIAVEVQHPLIIHDEDNTILGEYFADLFVENELIIELKATKSICDEHIAQLFGYMRASRRSHGLLINFGSNKLQIKKYILSFEQSEEDPIPSIDL